MIIERDTYRGIVYPWHCDFNDHMNVQYYMAKFDEATWHFMASMGITPSYLKKENRAVMAVEQHMKYFEELCAGDLIYIRTNLIELKSKAIVILHNMINSETNHIAAEAKMVGVHVDKKTRSAIAFPEEINRKYT